MDRSHLRFLLLQARNPGDHVRVDEHLGFAERLGVPVEQVTSVCMLTQPVGPELLEGHDMLLVGGSGHWSVLDEHPGLRAAERLLAHAAERGFPTFGSCFGFQLMVRALGGEVIHDEPNAEIGTCPLELTPEAASDPLFGGLPPQFMAQLGHKDRAAVMPAGVHNLARSERVPYQALVVPGKPVYATQFHPESTHETNRARFSRYLADYGPVFGEEASRRLLDEGFVPSPEASSLLDRFVRVFLLEAQAG